MRKKEVILLVIFIVFYFSNCSTTTIDKVIIDEVNTYESDVDIIISNNCLPCHAGAFPSAGLNLEGYENVRNSTENGNLLARINSITNPTPQSGLMSPISIATIEQWAIDGYIEN